MGLFSSSTKISVFSQVIPLTDDKYNPIKNIVIGSILTGNDISLGIYNNALNGSSIQVHRMLNYARDHYTLGLPQGVHHNTKNLDSAAVATAIASDLALPYGCAVDYNFITELTIEHVILPFLVGERQYNVATNRIESYPPGMDLPATYVPGSSVMWGRSRYTLEHRVTVESVLLNEDRASALIKYKINSFYANVIYNREGEYASTETAALPTTYFEETYILPDPTVRIGNFYCIAKYSELDSQGSVIPGFHWWLYDIATRVHPNINFNYTLDNTDSLFPVVPLRYNNVDYTAAAYHDTDLYKTSKKLLKIVGININTVGDRLNENPDIGEIDHAYITYGVNLQSNQKESIRYLVEFFDFLHDKSLIERTDNLSYLLKGDPVEFNLYSFLRSFVNRSDSEEEGIAAASLTEHGLDTSVRYSYITSVYKNGSIGSVGSVTKTIKVITRMRTVLYDNSDDYTDIDESELILRYQEKAGSYKEVMVKGLVHINRVYSGHAVITNLGDIGKDAKNNNFVIPLHYGICKRLPVASRTKLYNQALHIVINGYQETKVRWYQTGLFQAIMIIVSVIIAWYTWDLRYFYFAITMHVLTEMLPPKILLAFKIVLIAYAIYSGNVKGATTGATLTTAQYFLAMVAAVTQLATIPMELKLLDVMEEMEDLAVQRETALKELEDITKQLDTSSFLDAGLLLDPPRFAIVPNESPTAFYVRTLRNNAGLLVLDVVENYHTALLGLPEPDYNTAFGVS